MGSEREGEGKVSLAEEKDGGGGVEGKRLLRLILLLGFCLGGGR